MRKSKPNRKRNRAITIRMSEAEYDTLQSKVSESGLSKQAFINNAIRGATITSSDEIEKLKDISKTFSDTERQLRGLATNVNQMAHVANGTGALPTENELKQLSEQLGNYRKESEKIWRSIRQSISQQNHMEQ